MRFRNRILLVLVLTGVVPVVVLGTLFHRLSRRELVESAGNAQARAAEMLARDLERTTLESVQELALAAEYIPFAQLSRAEQATALQIPGRQLPHLDALALLDAGGRALVPPVVRSTGEPPGAEDALARFARSIPLAQALSAGRAVGPPYRDAAGVPHVAVAVRVEGTPPCVLAAEVSLAGAAQRLAEVAAAGDRIMLVDGRGEPMSGPPGALSPSERELVGAAARSTPAVIGPVQVDSRDWLAAYASTSTLGWGVLFARPASAAFGAAERVKGYTLFWAVTALVMALVMGSFLARGIARPVADLSAAARALTEGRYDRAVDERGGGELGDLARAFNHMVSQVSRRDEEIRVWNAQLQARVESATAKLRAAHDQVARTRRLAAVGSLGAGVAHALNNPLTSIIGLTTLAKRQVPAGGETAQLLDEALAEAQRAAGVVRQLRALTEEERQAGGERFALEKPLRAALDAQRARLKERGVVLRVVVAGELPSMQGDAAQMEQLVGHLVDNAATAMPGGGQLSVSLSVVEGNALRLSVADSGPGIPDHIRERIFDPFFTTRPGGGVGLGLSLVNGIVEAHHGRIVVESEVGQGAHFSVYLPAAAPEPHLI